MAVMVDEIPFALQTKAKSVIAFNELIKNADNPDLEKWLPEQLKNLSFDVLISRAYPPPVKGLEYPGLKEE